MQPPSLPLRRVCIALTLLCGCASRGQESIDAGSVVVATIAGPIGPATAAHVARVLDEAAAGGAEAVVLRIDTPGGLDTSMRAIVQDILGAKVPVLSFVAPPGARAASAGTYIVMASHVAAMSPGTSIGAATPVELGGGDGDAKSGEDASVRKAVNDAASYLESLARLRGRNTGWTSRAVREGASLAATTALQADVVDLLASDIDELLRGADGREVEVDGVSRRLATAGATVIQLDSSLSSQLLGVLTSPNVALLLMLLGVYGLFFELASPGAVFPGVIGALCLLLGLYALHVLPVSWAGVALLGLGVGLMVAEVFAPSFGILGLGGLVAFALGGLMLFDGDVPGVSISPWVVALAAALTAGFVGIVLRSVLRGRRRPVVSGREALVGSVGRVLHWSGERGEVHLAGERWQARASEPLLPDEPVRVTQLRGLVLFVVPLSPKNRQEHHP